MCLPFNCGGDRGDHGSPDHHSGIQHPPQAPQPPLPPPRHPLPSPQPYVIASPVKDAYDDHRTPRMAAGGEAKNRGAEAAPWHVPGVNKNGERGMGFDTTHAGGGVGAPAAGVHGSAAAAASYPNESADRMRAPPVAQMARRGGAEDNYPAAATVVAATPSPAANNFYGGHGRAYDGDYAYGDRDNRKTHGNSWW
ncbi:unnamed protein product [Urochloa decumbens]|uniref:Uncharacterized protein n=1 Tax=Urochloa decumbens TaxID=240449 RepID=A0ABC9E8H8_9POAL